MLDSVRTQFEGNSHVWHLGDLAPHSRTAFELGLWFETMFEASGDPSFDLSLELASPDLSQAVVSNALSVGLRP